MIGPTYTFVTVDLRTGEVVDVVVPAKATWTRQVNAPGSATLTMHIRQVSRLTVEPNLVAVYVLRGDQCVFAGYVESLRADGKARTVTVGLVELTRYLWRRTIRDTVTFTGAMQVNIVAALIAGTDTDGPGLSLVPTIVSGSITRDRTYQGFERTTVGDAITNLTGVIDGPDYELQVTPDGAGGWIRRVLIADNLSRDLSIVWRNGDPGDYAVDTDVGDHANRIDATGAGDNEDLLIATATSPTGEYPRLDGTVAHRNVTSASTLSEHAAGALAARGDVIDVPQLTLPDRFLPSGVGAIRPGDTFRVVVDDGAAQFDGRARLVAWEYTWERGSPVTVAASLATVPAVQVDGGPARTAVGDLHRAPAPAARSQVATSLAALDLRVSALERPVT